MRDHKWKKRSGAYIRHRVQGDGTPYTETHNPGDWRQCERCGMSEGMVKLLKAPCEERRGGVSEAVDLFDGMDVEWGEWRPTLKDARELVDRVDALAESIDFFVSDCDRAIALARKLKAWSVARAVRWLQHPETLERHGYDHMHSYVERVARRWLARWERQRMERA